VLFLTVILFVVLVCPQAVFGRKKEPVKKDDVIDALISVNMLVTPYRDGGPAITA
jgi:hypothetical protein